MRTLFLLLSSASIWLSLSGCASLGEQDNDDDETKDWSADRLYEAARNQLNDENYNTAIDYYEKLETRYPFGQFAQQALLESAYAHYKDGEPEHVLTAADRFIRLYPRHPNLDYAYYLKGLANFNRNFGFFQRYIPTDRSQRDQAAALQAFNDFSELITLYPDSRYTEDAQQRLIYLGNNIAEYDVHVARYYIQRGAYSAAVNRGIGVVENHPQTTAVPNALAVMLVGYTMMDMDDLADDTRRVLQLNYPEHPVLKREVTRKSDTGKEPVKWYRFWK